jgi:hypothetical protein
LLFFIDGGRVPSRIGCWVGVEIILTGSGRPLWSVVCLFGGVVPIFDVGLIDFGIGIPIRILW